MCTTASAPGEKFDAYVDALVERGGEAEAPSLVETFRPHWDHNLGDGRLGAAAFRSGDDRLAEPLLVRLRHSLEDWHGSDEMNDLAGTLAPQGTCRRPARSSCSTRGTAC